MTLDASPEFVAASLGLLFPNKSTAEQMALSKATYDLCGVFIPVPEPKLEDEATVARLVGVALDDGAFAEEIDSDRLRRFVAEIESEIQTLIA